MTHDEARFSFLMCLFGTESLVVGAILRLFGGPDGLEPLGRENLRISNEHYQEQLNRTFLCNNFIGCTLSCT